MPKTPPKRAIKKVKKIVFDDAQLDPNPPLPTSEELLVGQQRAIAQILGRLLEKLDPAVRKKTRPSAKALSVASVAPVAFAAAAPVGARAASAPAARGLFPTTGSVIGDLIKILESFTHIRPVLPTHPISPLVPDLDVLALRVNQHFFQNTGGLFLGEIQKDWLVGNLASRIRFILDNPR